jgi:hypothetical protein
VTGGEVLEKEEDGDHLALGGVGVGARGGVVGEDLRGRVCDDGWISIGE